MDGTMPKLIPVDLAEIPKGIFLFEGGLLVLAGLAALIFPGMASIATAVLLGWVLMACGIAGLIGAFATKPHVHFGWSLLSAAAAIVVGLGIAFYPLTGALALAFFLAAWLLVDGVSSAMIALELRRSHKSIWIWSAVSGSIDWLLALGIVFFTPVGGFLVVGIVVGVDLIFGGFALVMMALAAGSRGKIRAPYRGEIGG